MAAAAAAVRMRAARGGAAARLARSWREVNRYGELHEDLEKNLNGYKNSGLDLLGKMDYKEIAQQIDQEVFKYSQDISGWKLVKHSKKVTVSSKASKLFQGNLYRVEGIIPESTAILSDFLCQPANRVTWDKTLKGYNMVHRIDSDTFICHSITNSFAMGSVSPRDFVDLIHIKRYEQKMQIISSKSVEFPGCPPTSNYIRGYNHPCGYVCLPLEENPAHSKLVMFVQTEMKGKLSPSIVEKSMPSNLVNCVLNVRDGVKVHSAPSIHSHRSGNSSLQRKRLNHPVT